jgi:hypothetical protein
MRIKVLSVLLGAAVCATPAFAYDNHRSINDIEHREQLRIQQGIRNGELTRTEARRLEAEQARIRINERFDRMDGHHLTPRERERLYRELHHASRDIYHQKHDNQYRR